MDTTSPCVKCQVQTKYVEEQSDPDNKRFVFAYVITIKKPKSANCAINESTLADY
jgi:uncharacterized protein affecting Mg2+/Co2+ transport